MEMEIVKLTMNRPRVIPGRIRARIREHVAYLNRQIDQLDPEIGQW
jgi:hypothetical protein